MKKSKSHDPKREGQERERSPLLKESQAAKRLGLKRKTLQQWRWRGIGPAFVKLSAGAIRYEATALDEFINANRRFSTTDTGGQK